MPPTRSPLAVICHAMRAASSAAATGLVGAAASQRTCAGFGPQTERPAVPVLHERPLYAARICVRSPASRCCGCHRRAGTGAPRRNPPRGPFLLWTAVSPSLATAGGLGSYATASLGIGRKRGRSSCSARDVGPGEHVGAAASGTTVPAPAVTSSWAITWSLVQALARQLRSCRSAGVAKTSLATACTSSGVTKLSMRPAKRWPERTKIQAVMVAKRETAAQCAH